MDGVTQSPCCEQKGGCVGCEIVGSEDEGSWLTYLLPGICEPANDFFDEVFQTVLLGR
jgi:hypothetical protein